MAESNASTILASEPLSEDVQIRVHGPPSSAMTLVHLPGVHGHWTLKCWF